MESRGNSAKYRLLIPAQFGLTVLAAVALAWLAGLLCGALTVGAFAELLAQTLIVGSFMAALGIACSLACESTTRAMTGTILGWLAAAAIFAALAGIVTLVSMLAWLCWDLLHGLPPAPPPAGWPSVVYQSFRLMFYALSAALIGLFIQYRFDALAGRCTDAG